MVKSFNNYSTAFTCLCLLAAGGGVFAAEPTAEGLAFFEKKIRPVLVEHCYKCHSASSEKVKGGLLLDTRDGIRKGGESGHAVVPDDLKESKWRRLLDVWNCRMRCAGLLKVNISSYDGRPD